MISIHSLRVEGDQKHLLDNTLVHDFNPLPPCGGRLVGFDEKNTADVFQSTPSVWRETCVTDFGRQLAKISIHSLRVEGDNIEIFRRDSHSQISIHSLRVEGDRTHSTSRRFKIISIHSLRVEGDHGIGENVLRERISIHSLRVEGDFLLISKPSYIPFQSTPSVWRETNSTKRFSKKQLFQSTPSVWRETLHTCVGSVSGDISIHSLRVEGDSFLQCQKFQFPISIHSLRVEGDYILVYQILLLQQFQSTPSVWRETIHLSFLLNLKIFQSTPSVWRETSRLLTRCYSVIYFNPLPPCGGRQMNMV